MNLIIRLFQRIVFILSYLSKNTYIYYEQRKKDYNQKLVSIITKTHNVLKDLNIGDVSYTIAKIKEN